MKPDVTAPGVGITAARGLFEIADPAEAEYTLRSAVKRPADIAGVANRIDMSWTIRSAKPAGDEVVQLPVSSVRFAAATGLDSRVKAGAAHTFPVTVEGAAAGKNLRSLTVYASHDGGKSWKRLTVSKKKVSLRNPAKGKGISLRADITDQRGNRGLVTVHNAFIGT